MRCTKNQTLKQNSDQVTKQYTFHIRICIKGDIMLYTYTDNTFLNYSDLYTKPSLIW